MVPIVSPAVNPESGEAHHCTTCIASGFLVVVRRFEWVTCNDHKHKVLGRTAVPTPGNRILAKWHLAIRGWNNSNTVAWIVAWRIRWFENRWMA